MVGRQGILAVGAVVMTIPAGASGPVGPDAITGAIPSSLRWATDDTETAYSFDNTMCNVGDANVSVVAGPSTAHAIKGTNLFRLSADGRFEQLGQAWLVHDYCALQLPLAGCGTCGGAGGCLSILTPGCSDPHGATFSGSQSGLTPKWQVDAHTGEFPLPPDQGEGTDGEFRRRLRVKNVDIDPDLNPGALYFVEMQQVAADDATAGNQNNNASYRQVSVTPTTLTLVMLGETQQRQPGIQAWQDVDPNVTLVDVQTPGEGLFIVGYKTTDNGDGTWRYEYAVYNMNSHRSARAFRVPGAETVTYTDIGFHDVDYHSGEIWDGTDWPHQVEPYGIGWATTPYETDPNANALRWGTIYNFRFTADRPPAPAIGRLELFRPGDPGGVSVALVGPVERTCAEDLDASGDVGFTDLLIVLAAWGPCPPGPCVADLDGSGDVGFVDLIQLLAAWGEC